MYRVELHGMDKVQAGLTAHRDLLKNEYIASGCEAQLGKR
jgi:type VI secretion system secreted protein VgrG